MAGLSLAARKRIALAICPELAGGAAVADGGLAMDVATMPVWGNGRRPNFWGDLEVRAFVTACHRQMPIKACRERCAALFGADRTPSQSALHRYWMVLDRAQEHAPRAPRPQPEPEKEAP